MPKTRKVPTTLRRALTPWWRNKYYWLLLFDDIREAWEHFHALRNDRRWDRLV